MRKLLIFVILMFSLGTLAFADSQLDPGMGTNPPQNPDTAGTPQDNIDPGMQDGTPTPPPEEDNNQNNQNNTNNSQNNLQSTAVWICGQSGSAESSITPSDASNCPGVCESSGFRYTGTSTRDVSTIKSQCGSSVAPGQENEWVACQCEVK